MRRRRRRFAPGWRPTWRGDRREEPPPGLRRHPASPARLNQSQGCCHQVGYGVIMLLADSDIEHALVVVARPDDVDFWAVGPKLGAACVAGHRVSRGQAVGRLRDAARSTPWPKIPFRVGPGP